MAARQRAIFLLRHVGQLVDEQIAEHQRHREDDQEHRQPTIGDRPWAIVAMWRFAGWFGAVAWMI